jgi:signal transduction histidine kinase
MAKNGSRVEVLVTGFPLRDSRGAVVSAAAIMSDITERKQLERQLAQAQKLESIGQLAAGVAHEINTPVQFIGDNIRFLEESFGDLDQLLAVYAGMREAARSGRIDEAVIAGVEAREALADVDYLREEIPKSIAQSAEGVERIAAIVKAIREFSHPGAAEKAPVDLNRAVETTTLVSRNEWKYVADLQLDLAPGLPMVSCVRGEINQVILNLVVNAAHAIAEKTGGTAEKGQITVTTRADGEWAEVRVSDTGTGIPEKAQANVFNPFFTTKPVGKGTGQGLAIAHMVVVQKHRGTIHFETEPGKGTTFIVRLPINGTGKQAVMEPAA